MKDQHNGPSHLSVNVGFEAFKMVGLRKPLHLEVIKTIEINGEEFSLCNDANATMLILCKGDKALYYIPIEYFITQFKNDIERGDHLVRRSPASIARSKKIIAIQAGVMK